MGIGASAGGLEALQQLFDGMESGSRLAYVVVQHLSPDFESLMDELIGRVTELPVLRAYDGATLEADTVYVMPPNVEMIVQDGTLRLTEREDHDGLFLPIDAFFRSLAEDSGERAAAVILSGTGSDGSRGLRAVHAAGGFTISQAEETAKFDGMPRAARETGVVDQILAPSAMRAALRLFARKQAPERVDPETEGWEEQRRGLFSLLEEESGVDFGHYKRGTIRRRTDRRLKLSGIGDVAKYLERIEHDGTERQALYSDLLIGVTSFFRDPEAYEFLRDQVFPKLVEGLGPRDELRIWCAGCATGEEAYSMAILAFEAFEKAEREPAVRIFATDVHRASLEVASRGLYPRDRLEHLPPDLRERYFSEQGDALQVDAELRTAIVFAAHNVLRDPPFTRIHLVSCRNLLIYFKPPAQRKATALFHFALRTNGVLFLGPSESPSGLDDELATLDHRWKIFRKTREVRIGELPIARRDVQPSQPKVRAESTVAKAERVLLERHVPASFLVGPDLRLEHTFGGAGRYLRHWDGNASLGVLDLLEGELRYTVAAALKRIQDGVAQGPGEADPPRVARTTSSGGVERLEVRVQRLSVNDLTHYLVVLHPTETQSQSRVEVTDEEDLDVVTRDRLDSLEAELGTTKERLQATVEEAQASNQELQATNEELIASNEELHSTNEELQSVNEELYTVNAEYQAKIAELSELTDDMNHLLEATDVHTVFLDRELRIRRFTPQMARTFHIEEHDVGRPITHFASRLEHPELLDDLKRVLAGGERIEREVMSDDGSHFLLRVLAYRPQEDIEGVVLTLVDISPIKDAQRELQRHEQAYRTLAQTGEAILWRATRHGEFRERQPEWEAYTGQTWPAHAGEEWLEMVHPDDRARLARAWDSAIRSQSAFEAEGRVYSKRHDAYRYFRLRGAPLLDERGQVVEWIGNMLDFEEAHVARQQLREREAQLNAILEHSPSPIFLKDTTGRYLLASRRLLEYVGADDIADVIGKTDYDLFPGDVADAVHDHDRRVIRERRALEFEERAPVKNEDRVLLTVKFPLLDRDGEVTAIAGVSSDITARKAAEHEIRLAVDRRDHFLAMLSHELRNPLGAILNASYALEMPSLAEPQKQKAGAAVKRQALHVSRLLDDLLDVARVTQGKIDVRREQVDLRQVVDAAIESVRSFASSREVTIEYEEPERYPMLEGDEARLRQVVTNLLRNAIQFSGGKPVTIALGSHRGNATLEVRDHGVGLDRDECARVFELFYQKDESLDRSAGGLGVGLSLVKHLVELHRGSVTVDSQGRGHGATFCVTLPRTQDLDAGARRARKDENMRLKVVLVEDSEDNREMLELIVAGRGHDVVCAEDGEKGLQAILEHRPDIALVDIGLPKLDGFEVARRVREAASDHHPRLVALTGYGRAEDRERIFDAGFDEHLVKPVSAADLDTALAAASSEQGSGQGQGSDSAQASSSVGR